MPCLTLFLCSLSWSPVALPASPFQDRSLEGVWVAEQALEPRLDGPVDLLPLDGQWIARLHGETRPAQVSEDPDGLRRWTFDFLDGRFEGRQAEAGVRIEGHWIQAPGALDGYPVATPLHFQPAGGSGYTGWLAPAPQSVSLNIALIPGDGGRYRTFLRNPERNLGLWFRIETATLEGGSIRFEDASGQPLGTGRLDEGGERFRLAFPRFGHSFDFVRQSRRTAPGFYPRRYPSLPAGLPRPIQLDDGWPTAAPAEHGIDVERLQAWVQAVASFEPTGLREPYIHALLVAHSGELVVEEYFHDHARNALHDSRSAGKTIGSALLGIALHVGLFASVDDAVYPLFGGVEAFANPDPRKARLTLRHLVTMSSGLACNDDEPESPGNEEALQSQTIESDWHRYTLNLPLAHEPGTVGAYCSAGINLIGGAIGAATGDSLLRFFHERFAKPLGIDCYQFNLSPTHDGYLGGGLRLLPRDFLKLGQLYLDAGAWNGQRLFSEQWARDSLAPQASLNEEGDYGYAWWRKRYTVGSREIQVCFASGNGGQMLFVVPELRLVALTFAGNYSDGRTRGRWRDELMQGALLPAMLTAIQR